MTHHRALTLSPSLDKDVVFAIAGGTFTVVDILDIRTGAGNSLAARITSFDMSGLQLSVGDRTYISGPWKAGEQPAQQSDGMTSNWTIR